MTVHTNTSIKILTAYYKHKPGGFCKRLQMKINAYLNQGWEVHYIAVAAYPYKNPNLIPHILPTPFKNHDSLFFWIYFFTIAPWFTAWVAYKNKIQLISIFSLTYAYLCIPAKWISKAPLLTFVRTMKIQRQYITGWSKHLMKIEQFLGNAGFALSDSLIANCESIKTELEKNGKPKKDIQVLYNNIIDQNYDRQEQRHRILKEFKIQDDSFLLITTGLLIPRKNLAYLLEALAKFNSEKTVLFVIGEGPLVLPLMALAKRLGLQNQVIFTGWREDVLEILAGCDLFIFPSYREGISNSILEAMACGLPCIVSDIQENREIITHSEQCFPTDNPEVLAEMIDEALLSNEQLEKFRKFTGEDKKRFIFNWDSKVVEIAEETMKNI